MKIEKNDNKRTKIIPPEIRELIKEVNLLPLSTALPIPEKEMRRDYSLASFLKNEPNITYEEASNRSTFQMRQRLWEIITKFPEIRKLIWDGKSPNLSPEKEILRKEFDLALVSIETSRASQRYIDYVDLRENFKALIELAKSIILPKELGIESQKINKLQKHPTTIKGTFQNYFSQTNSISCEIDYNGEVKFSLNKFFTTFNKFDITRIRSCKKCGKVFCAGRKDQSCCPPIKKNGKVSQSLCKNSFNVSKTTLDRKTEIRKEGIKKWKIFVGEEFRLQAPSPKLQEKINLSRIKLELNENPEVTVTNVDFDKEKEDMPFRFFVDTEKGEKGYVEIKCNRQTPSYVKAIFGVEK